jgi:SpoVK/Ycf46/Vps4 family AAA+-type ATPase
MAESGIRRRGTRAVVQKKAKPVRQAKKSKPLEPSSVVLVLSGSAALRRRKAAELLAEELKLDLFRVDLSAVVSKYVGETEKNLNYIFDKAAASAAILFFDEADALFGKRSKVNDARDQYANAETAHFLQCIESHNGIVILTTNGKQRIDQAFSPQTPVVVIPGTTGKTRTKKK